MPSPGTSRPKVVHLVDNKRRDLYVAGLIAQRLDEVGIDCALEPLEATQAVLAAHRPDMIVFNHLSASHLAAYSRRLADLGVLVAVLPNEGLIYKREVLDFLALKAHGDSHIDLYFCWNEPFAEAVRRNMPSIGDGVRVIGVPRFDFYHQPLSRLFGAGTAPTAPRVRPRVLVCTNFVFAKYADVPAAEADKLFSGWSRNIPSYRDYMGAVNVHHANRERLFAFLESLASTGTYEVVLRPHPNEEAPWYRERVARLSEAARRNLTLEPERNITELILDCDLEISMDSCTTALESWLAGKPTIDLDMQHHPMLTNEIVQPLNVHCSDPTDLPRLVAEALAAPEQKALAAVRRAHIDKWCDGPDGTSAAKLATAIAEAIAARGPRPDLGDRLTFDDRRKGWKLDLLRLFGKHYAWQPWLALRGWLDPQGTYIKQRIDAKTMLPSDAREIRERLRSVIAEGSGRTP